MIGSIPAACCSGQLKAQDAFSPPSGVCRNPDSVSCPVSRSKFMFISFKTWRAIGASSCTAFSKWTSLSSRLTEPPCVPSRRSSKWRMRPVRYAGVVVCCTALLQTQHNIPHDIQILIGIYLQATRCPRLRDPHDWQTAYRSAFCKDSQELVDDSTHRARRTGLGRRAVQAKAVGDGGHHPGKFERIHWKRH